MSPVTFEIEGRKLLVKNFEELEKEKDRLLEEVNKECARVKDELVGKNILHKLPREIRDMIWRLLLQRPATIMPEYVQYHVTKSIYNRDSPDPWCDQIRLHKYGYLWEGLGQIETGAHGPYPRWRKFIPDYPGGRHENPEELMAIIPSEPTAAQAELISRDTPLPFTFDQDFGRQVGCDVIYRGEAGAQFPQIINRIVSCGDGLTGLSMMGVNKQALVECREILYGENSFAFDVASRPSVTYEGVIHDDRALTHYPWLIPGFPERNGDPQKTEKLNAVIARMFVPNDHSENFKPKFVAKDPMLRFFTRIGPVNTSLLAKIKIEGLMKTADSEEGEGHAIGFARILDIHTTILKNVCPNLKELTLQMHDKVLYGDSTRERFWDANTQNVTGKTDEEVVDEMIEKIANRLDSLRRLELGGQLYFSAHSYDYGENKAEPVVKPLPVFQEDWGKSVRWMAFVKERTPRQEVGQADNVEDHHDGVSHPKWSHKYWWGSNIFGRPSKDGRKLGGRTNNRDEVGEHGSEEQDANGGGNGSGNRGRGNGRGQRGRGRGRGRGGQQGTWELVEV